MRLAGVMMAIALAWAMPVHADNDTATDESMHGMTMSHDEMGMAGLLGSYPGSRDSSGTSWQPDTTPVQGLMGMHGEWMSMLHGYVYQVADHQAGPRGADKNFSESMFMAMASRPLGEGMLGLRSMFSLDPVMGKNGYPLLLQAGETADGVQTLVDRQHPHDLVMELAVTYSHPLTEHSSGFAYLGYPGEPALGPPTFMHRYSGMDIPEAPITHHWLDATHITYGVVTLGWVWRDWKLEASAFNGREPDQFRWNFDRARLDSSSVRLSWNPAPAWALQVSRGDLHSPEVLEPDVNQTRTTASAMYDRVLAGGGHWTTTFAWGQDANRPGRTLNGYLLESEWRPDERNTFFARTERLQNAELFEAGSPLSGEAFAVAKLSAGYIRDWPVAEHLKFGIGGLLSVYNLPSAIQPAYGSPRSWMLFVRITLH